MTMESTITISLLHPTDGAVLTAEVDAEMTGAEILVELVNLRFIPAGYYALAIKGGEMLSDHQSLVGARVHTGAVLRIIPRTEAG